eukprot:SAG25_NODE_19_length_23408_cov_10.997040_22_plen_144_part_00
MSKTCSTDPTSFTVLCRCAVTLRWVQQWGCWHPRGPVFLAGCSDGSVWMWNAPKATCMMVFSGHSDAACCGGFTPDGDSWHALVCPCARAYARARVCCLLSLYWCGRCTGKRVFTGSADCSVKVWNPKTGVATTTFAGIAVAT